MQMSMSRAFTTLCALVVVLSLVLAAAAAAAQSSNDVVLKPFRVAVPESVLAELQRRLEQDDAHWPDALADADDWSYGANLAYTREFVRYWREDYDWRKHEAHLNSFPQFTVAIDSFDVHFIHARSTRPDAVPLLIVHGWPGSVAEFLKAIPLLTEPKDSETQAFHVVAPSIPGFGFSSKPTTRGFEAKETAKLFVKLMNILGYPKYGLQGGDWGSLVTSFVAILDPENVIGLHLNFCPALPPITRGIMPALKVLLHNLMPTWTLNQDDQEKLRVSTQWALMATGYYHEQATKPLTLGYALSTSPTGLAAWLLEKFHGWSQCNGTLENAITKDDVLTDIMIYYVTGTITSSMRYYYENTPALFEYSQATITVPTAYADFPGEAVRPIRSWFEYQYPNIKQWDVMPRGGHFAALEQPELFCESVSRFFKKLRQNGDVGCAGKADL